jgi:hypothetical protein
MPCGCWQQQADLLRLHVQNLIMWCRVLSLSVCLLVSLFLVLCLSQDDFVEVGLISRPHGVRGEVKVQLITDEPKKRLGTAGKRCAAAAPT